VNKRSDDDDDDDYDDEIKKIVSIVAGPDSNCVLIA